MADKKWQQGGGGITTRIRERMVELGMSVNRLADLVGIPVSTLRTRLASPTDADIPADSIGRVAIALECSPLYLLCFTPQPVGVPQAQLELARALEQIRALAENLTAAADIIAAGVNAGRAPSPDTAPVPGSPTGGNV